MTQRLAEKSSIPIIFASAFYTLLLIRTAWITDDALITLRTVRNLLAGFGPVWNIGERVQAYTHPLWMLVLTGFIALTGEYFYTVIFVSIFVSLLATLLVAVHHASTWPAAVLAILLLGLSKSYGDYSTSGLENPLTHLLLAGFYLIYFRDRHTPRTLGWAALIASLGMVNRLDIGIIYLPALLYILWQVRSWRSVPALALGFLPLVAWELFALFYYGFLLPNTAYAKLNTDIPPGETFAQGLFYLLSTLTADPMTGFILLATIGLAFVDVGWQGRWLCLGIYGYLVYVVSIGGDYTLGRFLSAPLFCAVIYLARRPLQGWWAASSALAIGLTVAVGLMPWQESPLFVDGTVSPARLDNKGIADERKMLLSYSLLDSNRFNRLYESGVTQGWSGPPVFATGAVGRIGFTASPYSHIIDVIGLADPLLARLPARYDPNWRAGHPVREPPAGYLLTHRMRRNQLTDPKLAQYYEKLNLIVRGDLLDHDRWREIWRFNRGLYDGWIDRDFYRFPKRLPLAAADITRTMTQAVALKEAVHFVQDGLLITWPQPADAPFLEIGVDLDRFTLVYYREETRLAEQSITMAPVRLGDVTYHLVAVPAAVSARGYTDLHVYPRVDSAHRHRAYPAELTHNTYALTFLDLVDVESAGGQLHPEQLLELYYQEYLRGQPATRSERLAQLTSQMQAVAEERWATIRPGKLFEFLQLPEPSLHGLFSAALPHATTLTTADGTPVLNYLGADSRPTDQDAEEQGLLLDLYFDGVGQITQSYSAWFFIRATDSEEKWMIYDYYPTTKTDTWHEGVLYHFPALLTLQPGTYEITFGFWTPTRERLYADIEYDIYWIDLGQQIVPQVLP